MLLACVIITAVFSASLTTKTSGGKNDRRLLAAQAARQVTSRLRNFVTGCDCDIGTGACSAVSCTLQGPTLRAGVASWYFNNQTATPPITDCYTLGDPGASYAAACGVGTDTYALRVGYHAIKGFLPTLFEGPPFNARVVYRVSNTATINGRPVPRVDVDVKWTEPAP